MAYFINFHHYPGRNFSDRGYHFLTICTRRCNPYFGVITNGHTDLSLIGKIVEYELRKMVKNNHGLPIEDWIIMPNHIHLLIKPCKGEMRKKIRRFKSSVKSWTSLCGYDFHWQLFFHSYAIRDEAELKRIKWYIRNNPVVWKSDTLNQENPLNLPGYRRWIMRDKRYSDFAYEIQ